MTQLGPILTNSLAYWEKRRIPYNLALGALVVRYFAVNRLPEGSLPVLFVLAVLANVCYCAAYLIDVPVQLSEFRERWLPYRWMLWGLGMVFAGVVAWLSCTMVPGFC